ncbi:hypothetical protein [Candidatus Erwinia dacicola]|uniref:Uncharacterized protein n=2 Tax=Candidatus Erwinia dacicola TaxID=252393 RepID=A0A1E7YZN2_9GAMM|nr:hypothetical protein [Candidatus Erwinia dacicola]NJD00209.1 hypothetical protein [Candidatus Erwinia dacicola]NJD85864.1 hypothetical protein [Candidatus Erwinia dacicola]OFC61979.1 hypothetical protein BBW68_11215 [Candidatus Erwinia dacicola]
MSTEEDKKPPYAIINAQILSDYLLSLGVIPRCTVCLSESLSVPEVRSAAGSVSCGTPLGTYANLFIMKSAYGVNANINCYALICECCGHVMNFRAENVLAWRHKIIMDKNRESK